MESVQEIRESLKKDIMDELQKTLDEVFMMVAPAKRKTAIKDKAIREFERKWIAASGHFGKGDIVGHVGDKYMRLKVNKRWVEFADVDYLQPEIVYSLTEVDTKEKYEGTDDELYLIERNHND